MRTPELVGGPVCLDKLIKMAKGNDLTDPKNVALEAKLESRGDLGWSLLSSVLTCEVPGCGREQAVTMANGRLKQEGVNEERCQKQNRFLNWFTRSLHMRQTPNVVLTK